MRRPLPQAGEVKLFSSLLPSRFLRMGKGLGMRVIFHQPQGAPPC